MPTMLQRRKPAPEDEEDTDFLLEGRHGSLNRHDMDDDDDDFEFFTPLNIILVSLWSISLVLFAIWVATVVGERWEQMHSTVTSTAVKMQHADELEFPAITVCNMARSVELTTKFCRSYNNETQCHPAQDPVLDHCLMVNNDKEHLYAAAHTGLADTLMLAVSINVKKYPKASRFSGVHVSLHPPCDRRKGECPDEMSSSLMAAPGQPMFYRMTKVVNEYLNGTSHVHYEARDSELGDYKFKEEFGDKHNTVVLGFHYTSMSEMVIKELPRYTWLSLGAEVGGIVGFLFGIGIVNVIAGVIKAIFLGKSYVRKVFT